MPQPIILPPRKTIFDFLQPGVENLQQGLMQVAQLKLQKKFRAEERRQQLEDIKAQRLFAVEQGKVRLGQQKELARLTQGLKPKRAKTLLDLGFAKVGDSLYKISGPGASLETPVISGANKLTGPFTAKVGDKSGLPPGSTFMRNPRTNDIRPLVTAKVLTPDEIRTRLISLNKGLVTIKANKGLDPLTIALIGDNPEALKSLQGGDIGPAVKEYQKQIDFYNNQLGGRGLPTDTTTPPPPPSAPSTGKAGKAVKFVKTGQLTTDTPLGIRQQGIKSDPRRMKRLKNGVTIEVMGTATNPQTKRKLYNTGTVWVDDEGVIWKMAE